MENEPMERCSKTTKEKEKKISSGIIYWIPILSKSDLSHDTVQVWDFLKVTEWSPNSKLFHHPVCYHYESILYFSFLMEEGINAYYVKNYTIGNNDQLKEIPSFHFFLVFTPISYQWDNILLGPVLFGQNTLLLVNLTLGNIG